MAVLDHRLLGGHRFAVMDPCVVALEYWPDAPSYSLAPRQLASRVHLLPSLIDLPSLANDALGALVETALRWEDGNGTPYFSALVSSTEDPEALAGRLRVRFVARPPGSTSRSLLRWHDPRVFEHLLRILRPEQINHLLQPVTGWTWRNRQGSWVTTRADEEVPASAAMDGSTWRRLERLAVVNRTLDEAKTRLVDHADATGTVWQLVNRAHEVHGLTTDADCRLFVKQALEYGEPIHSHPAVAACLEQARAGQTSYVGACSRLSAEQLQARPPSKTSPRTEHHGV